MNKNLFKYYQAENGDTVKSLAAVLGVTRVALRNRLNGKAGFPVHDIVFLRKRWNLTDEQCVQIFLNE